MKEANYVSLTYTDLLSQSAIADEHLQMYCPLTYLIQVWSIDDGLSGRILNQNIELMILLWTHSFASTYFCLVYRQQHISRHSAHTRIRTGSTLVVTQSGMTQET